MILPVIFPGGAAICCALPPLGSEPQPLLRLRDPPEHGRSKRSHLRALSVRLLRTAAPVLRTTQLWPRNCRRSWQKSPPSIRSVQRARSAVARLSQAVSRSSGFEENLGKDRCGESQKRKLMAHYRKALAAATVLNMAISAVEAVAGFEAHSLSLMMDAIHNLSDEMALIFLYLAFVLSQSVSRNLLRTANLFNSLGLIVISSLLAWQAVERFQNPIPVQGAIPLLVGIAAAAANWGVAWFLWEPGRNNPAIRLAYIHNMGDVYVSLAPVVAGLLVIFTGLSIFDPSVAGIIAIWIILSTVREVFGSREELIWPEKIVCGHSDHDQRGLATG